MTSQVSTPVPKASHRWRFFRAGGFDQVRIETGEDLLNLEQLDQKLWVALSCPVQGLECDPKTLDLMDADRDGRIRAPEVIAAVKWAAGLLKSPGDLAQGGGALPLGAINDQTAEGRQLVASARQILENLGKKDAAAITVEDTVDTAKIFAQTRFNGDGIVVAESTDDPALKALIGEIVACLGADTDRSGKPGVSQAKVDQFFAAAQAFSEWSKAAEGEGAVALPLGAKTAEGFSAFKAVQAKIDDYFTRCRLAAFDARAIAALNREESDYLAIAAKDLTITCAEIAGFPLAAVAPHRPLTLADGVNPAWAAALARLRTEVIGPLIGDKAAMTEAEWGTVCGRMAAYDAWQSAKAGTAVAPLGVPRVREILGGKGREGLAALIAKDKALEAEFSAIATVGKLARYYRDLPTLLVNFVNFRDFYERKRMATFQAGILYLDQRSCELCLRVADAGRHAALAGLAKACLVYCDCTRSGGEKMSIVAAFTGGDSDNLMVGRNGIFYDRRGRDWDATITKIVDNPISLGQAFWAPYKKFVRLLEEQVAKRAAAAEASSSAKLETVAAAAATADKAPAAPAPKKFDVGTVAALGVGLGAIATMLGGFVAGFLALNWWQMPLALVGLLLAISIPSLVIAWLKLRQRNLAPILDANGWAINARAKLNIPFGSSLTGVAQLPPGAERSLQDPFAEKRSPWPTVVAVLVALALILFGLNHCGKLYEWTGFGTPPAACAPEAPPAGAPAG